MGTLSDCDECFRTLGAKCIHENVRTVPYPQEKTPLYINPSALFVPYSLKGEDKLQFALSSDESFPVHSTFFFF